MRRGELSVRSEYLQVASDIRDEERKDMMRASQSVSDLSRAEAPGDGELPPVVG